MAKKNKINPSDLPFPIALVIWEDSNTTDEESVDPAIFDSDEKRGFHYATVGWIIKDDDIGIVMAHSYRSDELVEKDISIPRSQICHTQYLK